MPPSKTKTDFILEYLNKNIETPAAEIVKDLAGRGVEIDLQSVYQVRSELRRKRRSEVEVPKHIQTRLSNHLPLGEVILQLLDGSDSLDVELARAVKETGYTSNADNFMKVVRAALRGLITQGLVVRDGDKFRLAQSETRQPDTSPVSEAGEAEDYLLLRAAVVDFARVKGYNDPDSFPDTLIRVRREFERADSEYRILISAPPPDKK